MAKKATTSQAKSKPVKRGGAGAKSGEAALSSTPIPPGKKILHCAEDSYDAIACETLRKLGIAPDAADYQAHKLAIIASYERARAEINEREKTYAKIKQNAAKKGMIARFGNLSKDERQTLLKRLCDAKERPSLIDEHLKKQGMVDAEDWQREKISHVLDGYRDWLESTKSLTNNELKSKRVKVDAKRRALEGKIATTPQWMDNLKIGRWFNYPLADEIAKAAVIVGERDGDRGELRGVLRVIGHACALQENVAWMKAARKQRLSCGTGRGNGRARFDTYLRAMLGGKPATNVTDYYTLLNCADMVIAPRFNDAVADFIWKLTDPRAWAEAEQRQADWRAREKVIIEAVQEGREIPPSALTPEERQRALLETVVDCHRLGWKWKDTAKKLVQLKLLVIDSPGGKNTPRLEKEAQFWSTIEEELPGLRLTLHRLKTGAK